MEGIADDVSESGEDGKFNRFIVKYSPYLIEIGLEIDSLLTSFEKASQEVLKLRKSVRLRELDLRESYDNNRNQYQQRLEEILYSFRGVSDSFDTLEKRIGSVGHVAVRIGDQLETLDKQRERAKDLKELMEIYAALEKDDGNTPFLLDKKKISGKINAEKVE